MHEPRPLAIAPDDLSGDDVRDLLAEHLRHMHTLSPRESVHALDLEALRQPDLTFWTARRDGELLGCGALKELTPLHGEIKSMRTAAAHQRQGVARAVVVHILAEARRRGYERVSLETGAHDDFAPAHRLYRSLGFTDCEPFDGYRPDPRSLFLTLYLPPPTETLAP